MLKSIFAIILFGLIALAILVMVIIHFAYKGVRKLREEAEENYYRNMKRKEQKEKNPFGDDYFKGSSGARQGRKQPTQYEQKEQKQQSAGPQNGSRTQTRSQEEPQKDTARRTTTSGGVTIIDDRDTGEKRKIFDHSDGEYVEFEEV